MKKLLDYCSVSGSSVKNFSNEKKYIATGDVINNKVVSFENVTYENKPSRANQLAETDEILFAKMKDTLKVLLIDDELSENIYSTGFFVIKANKDVVPKYLYWLFNSSKFNQDKDKNSKGATQQAINLEGLNKILIKDIPNLEEQKKIIDKIEKAFEIIELKKKQLQDLDELIKSQFVEMFENKEFPYVEFKEYMERCVDIGSNGANSIVMEHYNMTDTKDYAMVVRFTNLNSGDFVNDVKYINKEDYEFYSKSKVYGDEIIFCKIGSAGMNYIMPKLNMPVTLGLNQIMITPKNINTRYLYEYINSNEGKKYIKNNINGAVTKTITKHALWVFPVKTPPIELQNKFADIVKQIDKQKFEIQKSLEEMQKLQESLMNKYFGD